MVRGGWGFIVVRRGGRGFYCGEGEWVGVFILVRDRGGVRVLCMGRACVSSISCQHQKERALGLS